MSRFAFRTKDGLIRVYDYFDFLQTSVSFVIDGDGKTIKVSPSNFMTTDGHVERVEFDFNENSEIVDCLKRHDIILNNRHSNGASTIESRFITSASIANDPSDASDYLLFLIMLWKNSKTAFTISLSTGLVVLTMFAVSISLTTIFTMAMSIVTSMMSIVRAIKGSKVVG